MVFFESSAISVCCLSIVAAKLKWCVRKMVDVRWWQFREVGCCGHSYGYCRLDGVYVTWPGGTVRRLHAVAQWSRLTSRLCTCARAEHSLVCVFCKQDKDRGAYANVS